jgi:hypothetical protein
MRTWLNAWAFAIVLIAPVFSRADETGVTDDQRDFTEKVAQAIKTLRPKEEVNVVTSLRLKVDGPGGAKLIDLDKLYESCKGEHAICRDAFLKLVGAIPDAPVATTRAEVERVRKWELQRERRWRW